MTLERSVSNPAAYDTHLSPALLSERQYYTLPTKPKSTGYLTPTKGHKNGFNFHSVLDKTISDQTFATESSLTGFSNTAWASTSSVDHSKDRKSRYRSRNYAFDDVRHNHHHHHHNHHHHSSNPHAYRHERPANGSPAKDHVDSDSKKKNHKVNNPPRESISKSAKDLSAETPEKSATLPRNSSATLPRNSSATLSRNSSATLPRNTSATLSRNSSATLNNNTCSREVLLEFPSSMPKSAGRSSHSSAAKRSEKSKELKSDRNGLNRSLQPARSMPGLAETSQKEVRPHSADGRPRERKSCSLFFLFRRKKKSREDRTPSPVSKSKQNTRSRPDNSCATPQSVTRSEHQNLSSLNDRRPSSHSSSRPLLTPTQSKPPRSPKSPTAPSSLAQPQTDRTPQYTSRSRPQQRGERRHRTNTPASRTQSEERVRHEDLPPHPSLYKKAAEKANSNPNTPCLRSSNHRLDGLSRSRGNSDTVSNVKSAAVSSISAQNLKDSAGGSAQNLLEKSVHSTSKTDFEEDSHYQYTTSSSDRSSQRQSLRSQSLPSFGGDRLIPPDADFRVISDAEDFEYSPTDMKGPLNLSLCGCGFLGMYHLGVVSCLAQRGPAFLERVKNVGGASAGALMAAVLVTAPDKMEESAEHVQNLAKEIRRKPLGALTPGYSFTRSLRYMLDDILPEDAHELACGKLHVSMTNAQTKKNELMSDFKTRDELIEALVASCYIPVYAGLKMPTIRGKKYYDGGLSDNLPRFVAGRTITVSPFDGKSDIGPKAGCEIEKKAQFINFHNQDLQVSMNNVKKGAHAFFPPKRQYLQEYFEKGRFDASRFLIREGLYEINVQQQKKSVLYESSV